MKKIITLGVLTLFALSCFFPSVIGFSSGSEESFSLNSACQVSGDIIIVDDEGDGDYVRIKDALYHANPGDTIEVYSGTYYEHGINIVEERITLQGVPYELGNGNDIGKPFINGEGKGDLIDIKAKNVMIDGFRMENDGGPLANGIIGLFQVSDECIISNNDIAHTTMACIWNDGSDNKILNNNISHSVIRQGIVLAEPGHHNTIIGNIISDVETGILCWDSNQNTIKGNKIIKCSRFGIDLASSNYNTVEGNTFEDSTVGVQIYYSKGSRIKNNNFFDNQIQAQFFYGPIFYSFTNRWNGNYWNSPRLLPFPIRGAYVIVLFFFSFVQFDWHPAKTPYDI